MSHVEGTRPEPEFDFWEFVACARCHAPFLTEDGAPPQIPFWITECGHIVCNNHLSVDQSCVQCGSQGIQVAPLQRKMEPPMSDWFRPATQSLESLAFSARFQIETLASLVRYYRKKCHQHRTLLDRMKTDSQLLRKKYEDLKIHHAQMKESYNRERARGAEPSETANANGKRAMLDSRSAHSNSSPRSGVAPAGPERLTLQPQPFTPRIHRHSDVESIRTFVKQSVAPDERPGSSRFAEQYAYGVSQHDAPSTASSSRPSNNGASMRQQTSSSALRPPTGRPGDSLQMLPPVDAHRRHSRELVPPDLGSPSSTTSSQMQMPPPAVPQLSSSSRMLASIRPSGDPRSSRDAHPLPLRPSGSSEYLQSNRFLSTARASSSQQSSSAQLQTQRFVPVTPSLSGRTVATSAPVSRRHSGPELSSSSRRNSGGQRVPFIPQGG